MVLEVMARVIQQEQAREVKLSLLTCGMTFYVENPK